MCEGGVSEMGRERVSGLNLMTPCFTFFISALSFFISSSFGTAVSPS